MVPIIEVTSKQTSLLWTLPRLSIKVLHRRLANKLEYYGIRNDILQWVTAWLSGWTQNVAIDGVCRDPAPVLSGVPQGSVFGLTLFLIFMNDLPDNINSTVRLFADDCVLYRNIRRSEDQQILRDDLNKLAQWEEAWLIKFSVAKCHLVRVTKHPLQKQSIHDYSLHNQVLENICKILRNYCHRWPRLGSTDRQWHYVKTPLIKGIIN